MDEILKNIQDVITSESITTIHNTPHFSPPIVDKRRPTDAAELQRIIMAGPFESSCLDALPTALLKKTLQVHLPVFCKIINMSLDEGIFPGRIKAADVTPIINIASLDQNVLKNSRPVSNLAYILAN